MDEWLTRVPPLITAALAIVGFAVREWRQRRSDHLRFDQALERASREASFVQTWLDAHDLLDAANRDVARLRVERTLRRTYDELERLRANAYPPAEPESLLRRMARAVLVPGLRGRWTRVWQVLYYLALGWLALWSAGGLAFVLDPQAEDSPLIMRIVVGVVMTIIFGVLPAAFCRWRALMAHARATRRDAPWPPPQTLAVLDRAATS